MYKSSSAHSPDYIRSLQVACFPISNSLSSSQGKIPARLLVACCTFSRSPAPSTCRPGHFCTPKWHRLNRCLCGPMGAAHDPHPASHWATCPCSHPAAVTLSTSTRTTKPTPPRLCIPMKNWVFRSSRRHRFQSRAWMGWGLLRAWFS